MREISAAVGGPSQASNASLTDQIDSRAAGTHSLILSLSSENPKPPSFHLYISFSLSSTSPLTFLPHMLFLVFSISTLSIFLFLFLLRFSSVVRLSAHCRQDGSFVQITALCWCLVNQWKCFSARISLCTRIRFCLTQCSLNKCLERNQ